MESMFGCSKGSLWRPESDLCHVLGHNALSDEEWWRAMRALSHVRRLQIGHGSDLANRTGEPLTRIPNQLFQSAISVKHIGRMRYNPTKSILSAVNPATLSCLDLDMVQDHDVGMFRQGNVPGDGLGGGRIVTHGATSGLLSMLTGHCTALRTLTLRRIGQKQEVTVWRSGAEEASYPQWASFIYPVKGTV